MKPRELDAAELPGDVVQLEWVVPQVVELAFSVGVLDV